MLAIHIYGGSNSVMHDGWVGQFAKLLDGPLINRSVGATTSLMALYRALLANDLRAGDQVVWEYALNEVNHVRRGYSLDLLLRNVGYFIDLCRSRNCRLIALIFTPRGEEMKTERDPYYASIIDIFKDRSVLTFDVSTEYRKKKQITKIPAELFDGRAHYAHDQELMLLIAKGVRDLSDAAQTADILPEQSSGGKVLQLVTDFCDSRFENSLLSIPTAKVPLHLTTLPKGQLIAIYCVCNPVGDNGIRTVLETAGRDRLAFRFSATNIRFNKPVLKAISVENAAEKPWIFEAGDSLGFSASDRPGMFYSEHQTKKLLRTLEKNPQIAIAGLLFAIATA